jgi:hypothetical protein
MFCECRCARTRRHATALITCRRVCLDAFFEHDLLMLRPGRETSSWVWPRGGVAGLTACSCVPATTNMQTGLIGLVYARRGEPDDAHTQTNTHTQHAAHSLNSMVARPYVHTFVRTRVHMYESYVPEHGRSEKRYYYVSTSISDQTINNHWACNSNK